MGRVGPETGLSSLPVAAIGPVSSLLGTDDATYHVRGLAVRNPLQHFTARFSASGVAITAGSTRFGIAVEEFGRSGSLHRLGRVAPVASANRVSYRFGALSEYWANGPAGLEQGFSITSRPAGIGALSLSMKVPAGTRLVRGSLLLPGGLGYTGLSARDAGGRALPAWLAMSGGRTLLSIDDRGARYPVRIDPIVEQVEQAKLTASDKAAGDFLGSSVAVSGNTIVVGAPGSYWPGSPTAKATKNPGAVYVFQKGASGWANMTQTAKLTASDGAANGFGWSVALAGNTILVGAPSPQSVTDPCGSGTSEGNPGAPGDPGAVYVFTLKAARWVETSKLVEDDNCTAEMGAAGIGFGWSVAISGNTVVVGAPFAPILVQGNVFPTGDGEVYVFVKPAAGWPAQMTPSSILTASNPSGFRNRVVSPEGEGVQLGWSVAISGSTIVAGEPGQYGGGGYTAPGAVDVFVRPASGWPASMHQTAQLINTSTLAHIANPYGPVSLGYSVAISGATIVAGAPNTVDHNGGSGELDVYTEPVGGWHNATQKALLMPPAGSTGLGFAVAMDADTVVSGEGGLGSNPQTAYVFQMPAHGWASTAPTGELASPIGTGNTDFGDSVAISGSTVVVGVPRGPTANGTIGIAYMFHLSSAPAVG